MSKRPHAIHFDQSLKLTRGSFKDECDPNLIVAQYAKTGIVNHIPRIQPQYGDAPEGDFFEAACVSAEIRSRQEAGELDLDEIVRNASAPPEPQESVTPAPVEPETPSSDTSEGDA